MSGRNCIPRHVVPEATAAPPPAIVESVPEPAQIERWRGHGLPSGRRHMGSIGSSIALDDIPLLKTCVRSEARRSLVQQKELDARILYPNNAPGHNTRS